MPGLPRVAGAEVVRAPERRGFVVVRKRGSPIAMRRGSAVCVAPNCRKQRIGTLAGVLNQAGVGLDEFIGCQR
ncbi:MAG TPA: type II toxin-antitoxin system HicA family toxin [Casimicrobiaceae bacterium]|nr:type II toxin-antitoxin system HicA family toxin [Casimicrobiaceae bacterium]